MVQLRTVKISLKSDCGAKKVKVLIFVLNLVRTAVTIPDKIAELEAVTLLKTGLTKFKRNAVFIE